MNARRVVIFRPSLPRPYLAVMLAWQLFGGLLLLVDAVTPWTYSHGLAEGSAMTAVVGGMSTVGASAALAGLFAPPSRRERGWLVEACGHLALSGSTTAFGISTAGADASSVIEWSAAFALAVASALRAVQLVRHPVETAGPILER